MRPPARSRRRRSRRGTRNVVRHLRAGLVGASLAASIFMSGVAPVEVSAAGTVLTTSTSSQGYQRSAQDKVAYLHDGSLLVGFFDGSKGVVDHVTTPHSTPATTQVLTIPGDEVTLYTQQGSNSTDIWVQAGAELLGSPPLEQIQHGTYNGSTFTWDSLTTIPGTITPGRQDPTVTWTGKWLLATWWDDTMGGNSDNVFVNWTTDKTGKTGWLTTAIQLTNTGTNVVQVSIRHSAKLGATIAVYGGHCHLWTRTLLDSKTNPSLSNWNAESMVDAGYDDCLAGYGGPQIAIDENTGKIHVFRAVANAGGPTYHGVIYWLGTPDAAPMVTGSVTWNSRLVIDATSNTTDPPDIAGAVDVAGTVFVFWATSVSGGAIKYVTLTSPYTSASAETTLATTGTQPRYPHVPAQTPLNQGYVPLVYQSGTGSPFSIVLDTSIAAATGTAVSATPSPVNPGGTLTENWSSIVGPTAKDWMGLYSAGAPDSPRVNFQYTTGGVSGSLPFTVPPSLTPGPYEVRLFTNDSFARLAVSSPITIQAPSVSGSPSPVNPGGTVTASWSNIFSPTAGDWVGLYGTGALDSAFLSKTNTTGSGTGTVPVSVPGSANAGTYELRLFLNNGTVHVATSGPITVQAITLSVPNPTTVNPGGTVGTSWTGIINPTAFDWIGFYSSGAADSAFLSKTNTTGAGSGSLLYNIPASVTVGAYNLRLFLNNGTTHVAVSGSIIVQGVALSASPSAVSPGGTVTANWGGILTPTAGDWIGLYTPGAPDNPAISQRYTTGTGGGSVPFTIPPSLPLGTYELRLFSNNTFTRLAVSGPFTVEVVALSASPSPVNAGGTLTATWSGIITPTAKDWIGLYLSGAPDSPRVNWEYTTGAGSGNQPFTVPSSLSAGTYELRVFTNDTFTRLATSGPVTVQLATVSANPSPVNLGGTLTESWGNVAVPTAKDWIGLYSTGAPDSPRVNWQYTTGMVSGSLPFSVPASLTPGTYEVRLFTNDAFTRLTTSSPITIQLPPYVFGAVGMDNGLWVLHSGSGYISGGGTLLGAPAVVAIPQSSGPAVPLYIVTGSDHSLYVRNDSHGWQFFGGAPMYCIDNPGAAVIAGTLYVACQGQDHALWHGETPAPSGTNLPTLDPTGWQSLGGVLTAGPAVASVAGTPTYFVIGSDQRVYSRDLSSSFVAYPWTCIGHPAVATSGSTSYFACHGSDNALWYSTNTGSGWSPPQSLGGVLIDGVGLAATSTGPIFFVEGTDQAVYQRTISSGWTSDGGEVNLGVGGCAL